MLFDQNFISGDFIVNLIKVWRILGPSPELVLSCDIEDVHPEFGNRLERFLDSGFFSFQKIPQSDFKRQLTLIANHQSLDMSAHDFLDEDWTAPSSNDELFHMLRQRCDLYRANATLFLVSDNFLEQNAIDGVVRMTCPGVAHHEILLAYAFNGSAWRFVYPELVIYSSIATTFFIINLIVMTGSHVDRGCPRNSNCE